MKERKWSQRKVVDAIQLWVKSGRPLSRVWKENKSLFRAAVTHFGNWELAATAAGFKCRHRRRWSEVRIVKGIREWADDPFAGTLLQHDAGLAMAAKKHFGSVERALELLDIDSRGRNWTRKKVVDTIQAFYVQGKPIRLIGLGDIRLYYVAKRRFGSWQKAVEAAGLIDRYRARENLRSWSPAAVTQAIQAWHSQHGTVNGIWHRDKSLYSVAKKHFGSWANAVRAAKLPATRRKWSRSKVVEDLRALYSQLHTISSAEFIKLDSPLVAAAYRFFGSWPAALSAAGIIEQTTTVRSKQLVG